MKKKEMPRLQLNRETLRRLESPTLERVNAGDEPPSSQICCPTATCP